MSFSCSPVGPKKSRVAGLYLDPAAMFPSYTPWLPPLALPKLSPVLSGERIQHPGQGTDQPYSRKTPASQVTQFPFYSSLLAFAAAVPPPCFDLQWNSQIHCPSRCV